jgi:hypothetical protein
LAHDLEIVKLAFRIHRQLRHDVPRTLLPSRQTQIKESVNQGDETVAGFFRALPTVLKPADAPANARISSIASPGRHAKSKESNTSAGKYPPNGRAEIWHCRRDAMGSLLRALDLSPRCNL